MMPELIRILHEGGYSCVIANGDVRVFSEHGVSDLYHLLNHEPSFLKGSLVADKVVGKPAAALLVLAEIQELYTDVISAPALTLLTSAGIKVAFAKEVPLIRNRDDTGYCPLETMCANENSAEQIWRRLDEFLGRSLQSPAHRPTT